MFLPLFYHVCNIVLKTAFQGKNSTKYIALLFVTYIKSYLYFVYICAFSLFIFRQNPSISIFTCIFDHSSQFVHGIVSIKIQFCTQMLFSFVVLQYFHHDMLAIKVSNLPPFPSFFYRYPYPQQ